jgi:hypothetical protein
MRITTPAARIRCPAGFNADRNTDRDHRATRGKPKKSSTRASGGETFCVVPRRARLRPLPCRRTQTDSDLEEEAHD